MVPEGSAGTNEKCVQVRPGFAGPVADLFAESRNQFRSWRADHPNRHPREVRS
jgi:hypothetical protein